MPPADWPEEPQVGLQIHERSDVPTFSAAFVASDNGPTPGFAVVTMISSNACPVLGEQLARAARDVLCALPLVLVYRDERSEWRTYGDPQLVFQALKLDFDALRWVDLPPLKATVPRSIEQ